MKDFMAMRRRFPCLLILAALAAVSAACAGASMDADLGPRYGVIVINELDEPMIVSVDDGTTTRLLGTVGPDREERFILDGAPSTTITLIASDEADSRTLRRTVVLRAGESVEVRLD
ncbi:MAG: hypothetical protein ACOCUW_00350 [Gemmatimonadota bacterium]